MVVDLRQVSFVDCGGADLVSATAHGAAARGVDLRVLPGPAVRDLLALLGGWVAIGGPDATAVLPPAAAEPGPSRADVQRGTEYDHLPPLFVERDGLRPADPRRAALRDELILGYLPIARHIARRHRARGENPDDLEQVATLGLINAVDRFDVQRGVDFLAYAVPTINGEVQRHYRDRTSTIRIPRRIRQLQSAVHLAVEELRRQGGRAPRPSDIARHLGIDLGDVLDALEAGPRAHVSSLDEPFPGDEAAPENTRFAAALQVDDSDLDLVEDRESLAPLIAALTERDRQILLRRFYGNQTQSQIADELGISQMHVSRLLGSILARLRAGLEGAAARRSS
ncbi:SigB/SigF/SigG family RNA polymerase sigma factor [Pseudonocardia sp. S2-4]|uniref:SigB/SigF/SigG family RNA polymerase sigma factor n=2 Tax=Pseudonocardia humida TaxID=2800819 RepID=A0ABT0ZV69_9PSEU|nr:SigB/SigF/SigG family RNA polymerase sigma factor [Pseudonocardia humida]